MVAISRLQFKNALNPYSCRYLVHPNEATCTLAALNISLDILKGSSKYYALMYAAQNAFKYKSLTTADIKPILFSYVRSVVTTSLAVIIYATSLCSWRNLTGRYDKDTIAYFSGLCSGLSMCCLDPKRRPLVSYSLCSLAGEALIRRLYQQIKRSKTIETFVFMTCNAILMYKMRTKALARFNRDIWFFRAPFVKKDNTVKEDIDYKTGNTMINACPHAEIPCTSGQCFKHVLKDTAKYVGGATLFTMVKLFLTRPNLRRNPLQMFTELLKWKNMKLAAFFGWYVGVFKGISCFFCRMNKADCAEYALIGGFLAGISYRFSMNITIFSSLILYVARIVGRELQYKYQLPKYGYIEICMVLASVTLMNTRVFAPECCPRGFHFMLNTVTRQRFADAFDRLTRLFLNEIQKT